MSAMKIKSAEEFKKFSDSKSDIEMTRWAAADEVWIAVLEKYPNLSRIVALNRTISLPILIRLSKSNDWLTRCDVAMKRRITPSMFHALSRDPEPAVRKRIALNPKAPLDVLQILADDQDKTVSDAAKERLESR
ncbi:hypothetical protein [Achromobacter sp. NCFB-sbj8-Ac1-l]|uniref:hypothetical protein n=1 Tax=unclassified Achromobacter TaxID=2626865 RepID=UPI0040468F87